MGELTINEKRKIIRRDSNNSIKKTDLDLSGPIHFFGSKKIFCNIYNSR